MTQVVLDRLVKRYGQTTAVDGIDLNVVEGEFLVLLGPSGCGKTTTLRCIAGLEPISEGRIFLGETVVSQREFTVPPERRHIGMVFQSYAVWPHMTVFENVAFGLKLKKLSRGDVADRVGKSLDLVGLRALAERGIHQLSGGQQQRVALARAVALEPRVLLFDEPLSNLDAKLREYMRYELRQLQRRLGITAIYVTHDQHEAMVVADRIALMNEGRIEQVGAPGDIYHRPVSLFAASFVGLANTLRGRIAGTGPGGLTRVLVADGTEFFSTDTGLAPGSEVDLIFRPEHLRIGQDSGGGPNSFSGLIEETVFLGNISDVYLRLGKTKLRAQVSPAAAWPAGTMVEFGVPAEDLRLIPAAAPSNGASR